MSGVSFGSTLGRTEPSRLRSLNPYDCSAVMQHLKREFFIDNLLVRIHFIIVMIRWTGLAPWEFEFPLPGSLTSTFLLQVCNISIVSFALTFGLTVARNQRGS